MIVNAAAYTAVDAAETDEERALAVNRGGPANSPGAASRPVRTLIHVSTDYVFDGRATRPYEPDDPTGPNTAYGRTKLAGERAATATLPDRCLVVRTAWVYGGPGPNFVDTMLRLERERDTVDVVADQHGSPTWAADLAGALVELGGSDDHARHAALRQRRHRELVRPRPRDVRPGRGRPGARAGDELGAFVRPAPRPAWSVLSTRSWTAAGLTPPRPWTAALAECLGSRARG